MNTSKEPYFCKFETRPKNVLLIKRLNSEYVTKVATVISQYLFKVLSINIFIEESSKTDLSLDPTIHYQIWNESVKLDFIVEIGGDGTLLWVSKLFPKSLPPIIGISMGTLGYLNQFQCSDTKEILNTMCYSTFPISLRQRLDIELYDDKNSKLLELTAVNECVIDRGNSPFLTVLEVYYNEQFFTNVSADGLILATPSGSTAYSMSAGGPLVHPRVPCFLFTPICPHSLSFRPLIIPDTATLRIEISHKSDSSAWIAVDGRSRTEIRKGMQLYVKLSKYPFPIVLNQKENSIDPWLDSLKKLLNWNQKFEQQAVSLESLKNMTDAIDKEIQCNSNSNDSSEPYDTYHKDQQMAKMKSKESSEGKPLIHTLSLKQSSSFSELVECSINQSRFTSKANPIILQVSQNALDPINEKYSNANMNILKDD